MNNFDEFTMLSASNLAPYIGFTEDEVEKLRRNIIRILIKSNAGMMVIF